MTHSKGLWPFKTPMVILRAVSFDVRVRPWLVLAGLLLGSWPAAAQQTRTDEIGQQVADKQRRLTPYEPGGIEKIMLVIEEKQLLRRFSAETDGFYPKLGGLSTGSGFAAGPGYRRHFGRDGLFDASAAVSMKNYRLAQIELQSPSFANQALAIQTSARYRHYPQERFFGLGLTSSPDDRVAYLFEDITFTAGVLVAPNSPLRAGVRGGYSTPEVGRATGRRPSIETRFSDITAPGLVQQPDYLFGEAFVEVDYRDFPGNPRNGGRYRLGVTTHEDRDFERYSFHRLDAEATQFIPFFDKRRVIALRALAAFTDPRGGHEVPFYMMPFVGGPESLRGFRERRFADRNLLLFNAEYRYEIFAALDAALFIDAGTVAPRIRDLRIGDMKTDYGIGFRFGTRTSTIMRFDIGLGGGEGTRYFLKFGPVFPSSPW